MKCERVVFVLLQREAAGQKNDIRAICFFSPHEEKSNRGNSNDCENTRACSNPPNTVPYPDQNVMEKCEVHCTRSVTNLLTKFESMVDNDMQDNNGRNYCYHLTN